MPPAPSPRPPAAALDSVAGGFVAGAGAGALLVAAGLVLLPQADLWTTSPSAAYAGWIALRSVAIYGLLLGLAGAVGAALLHPLLGRRHLAAAASGALLIAAVVLLHLTVHWQLDLLAGLPLDHPERARGAWRHALAAVAVAAVAAAGLRPLLRRRPLRRAALLLAAAAAVALAAAGVALAPGAAPTAVAPRRVVVVGLDGLSFRVLAPMMAAGELPSFRRLVDEGAWGSILTYGTASSPRVWTSLATGKKTRDHGIDDFVAVAGAGYRPRPLGRRDWRARPLWELLGDSGRTVAVVDWLVSHPAQAVNGRIVTRLNDRAVAAWPAAARDEVAALLAARPLPEGEPERSLVAVDRAFAVADAWLERDTDFLALYTAALDSAEHHAWRGFRPDDFDPARWGPPPADAARTDLIPVLHRRVDQRLGALLDRLDPADLLIVLSDHGQLAAARPRVEFRADPLLAALGWAELDGDGRVDPARSRVYPLPGTAWVPNLRLNVNRVGRERDGVVAATEAPALAAEVAATLAALRLDDGAPLFARVDHLGAAGGAVDVQVLHSLATWSGRGRDRAVVIGDRRLPLAELLEISTELTGDHDHQGVLILRGAGVRPGPIGPRSTLTAAHHLLHHLCDKVDAVDRLLPPLRRLGLVETATTLDLTPTVLHAFALPLGRDMAGRALTELLSLPHPLAWTDTWERPAAPPDAAATPEASDDEVLERLRSLGYIQ